MRYTTYENRNNPHITIHIGECNQIAKNGGKGRGEYYYHDSIESAIEYARSTGLPIKMCSFCNLQ